MTAVMVEWLGRGGIAQLVPAWVGAAEVAGVECLVVTRADRELAGTGYVGVPSRRRALLSHRAVAAVAAAEIRAHRPALVVIQNSIVPAVEGPVYAAATAVGAEVLLVVHDHRLHERRAGLRLGFDRLVRRADRVVAHSAFVAEALPVDVTTILPLPAPAMIVDATPVPPPEVELTDGLFRAVHFGVLHRGYKGGDVFAAVAAAAGPAWSFTAVGHGARSSHRVQVLDRYVRPGELRAVLNGAAAAVLPYRFATQSAAVPLAQALGAVPVATAVGGIPEQIEDGEDGILLSLRAGAEAWVAALARLQDGEERSRMAAAAEARAIDLAAAFTRLAGELLRS